MSLGFQINSLQYIKASIFWTQTMTLNPHFIRYQLYSEINKSGSKRAFEPIAWISARVQGKFKNRFIHLTKAAFTILSAHVDWIIFLLLAFWEPLGAEEKAENQRKSHRSSFQGEKCKK